MVGKEVRGWPNVQFETPPLERAAARGSANTYDTRILGNRIRLSQFRNNEVLVAGKFVAGKLCRHGSRNRNRKDEIVESVVLNYTFCLRIRNQAPHRFPRSRAKRLQPTSLETRWLPPSSRTDRSWCLWLHSGSHLALLVAKLCSVPHFQATERRYCWRCPPKGWLWRRRSLELME